MKKTIFGLCVLIVFLLLAAGCGKKESLNKGRLRGNVSTMVPGETDIITKINKARVTVVEAGLFDDTDDSGSYFISGITPGSYTVEADYTPGMMPDGFGAWAGGCELNGETEDCDWDWEDPNVIAVSNVTITAGVTTTLDFILFGY